MANTPNHLPSYAREHVRALSLAFSRFANEARDCGMMSTPPIHGSSPGNAIWCLLSVVEAAKPIRLRDSDLAKSLHDVAVKFTDPTEGKAFLACDRMGITLQAIFNDLGLPPLSMTSNSFQILLGKKSVTDFCGGVGSARRKVYRWKKVPRFSVSTEATVKRLEEDFAPALAWESKDQTKHDEIKWSKVMTLSMCAGKYGITPRDVEAGLKKLEVKYRRHGRQQIQVDESTIPEKK